jgi:hypothetical protein
MRRRLLRRPSQFGFSDLAGATVAARANVEPDDPRLSTSASQARESTLFTFAETINEYIAAAALTASVRPREQPCFFAKGYATQPAFRRVVGQTNPSVVEKALCNTNRHWGFWGSEGPFVRRRPCVFGCSWPFPLFSPERRLTETDLRQLNGAWVWVPSSVARCTVPPQNAVPGAPNLMVSGEHAELVPRGQSIETCTGQVRRGSMLSMDQNGMGSSSIRDLPPAPAFLARRDRSPRFRGAARDGGTDDRGSCCPGALVGNSAATVISNTCVASPSACQSGLGAIATFRPSMKPTRQGAPLRLVRGQSGQTGNNDAGPASVVSLLALRTSGGSSVMLSALPSWRLHEARHPPLFPLHNVHGAPRSRA